MSSIWKLSWFLSLAVFALWCLTVADSKIEISNIEEECDLLIHLITFGGSHVPGIGIYAGRDFEQKSYYQKTAIIPALMNTVGGTILTHFIEGYNETHDGVTLGYSMIWNHVSANEDKMVEKLGMDEGFYDLDGEPADGITYSVARDVRKGEQVFSWYGDTWFNFRTIPEISTKSIGGDYLFLEDPHNAPSRVPGCPTMTTRVWMT